MCGHRFSVRTPSVMLKKVYSFTVMSSGHYYSAVKLSLFS